LEVLKDVYSAGLCYYGIPQLKLKKWLFIFFFLFIYLFIYFCFVFFFSFFNIYHSYFYSFSLKIT
jgi:hypothetical protein